MRSILSALLIALLVALGFLFASTDFDARRVVDCSMAEYHPDLVKYREPCRAMRRGAR